MPTDDEQSNGAAGFASSDVKEFLVGVVTDASEDDGCHIQNRPRRSRTESVKIRENREAEAEASKAVASNHSRPALKDTTNLQIAPSVRIGYSSADDSNSLPSSCGATSPDSSDGGDDDDDDCGYNDDDGSVSEAPSPPSLNDSGAATATDACVRSRVDNIHINQQRPNYLLAREKCNFSSIEDVNKWFPPYSSRGAFNCPQSLINAVDTRKGKSLVVGDWRKLSTKQQQKKWDSILLAQQQQKQPSARKVRRASDVDTVSVQQPPRRKRRTLADDMNESEDDGAWERVLTSNDRAAQRRNKKNERAREKTQQRKQQQQPTIINGVLDGGEIAAETSAAAAAMKVSRHRSVNQPPTTRRHLNDQLVNRLISNTENACMRVATATQPQAGVDLGHAFTATMVVSMTNVQRSDSNGGRTNASLINGYKIRAVNPGAERAEDILCAALVRRQLSRGRSVSDILSASDNDDDILMLSNHDELREHNERENSDRTRARTEEDEDIERSLEEDTSNLILM